MSQDTVAAGPDTGRQRRRRLILIGAIAVAMVVAVSLVAVSCLSQPTATPPTVRVDRGPVALAVSASGNIAPSGQQKLGFANGGTVRELAVKVGDRVQPGQVLARIDDTEAQQTLLQRRATLNQQLATLDKLRGGVSVTTSQATLAQARDAEAATRRQVEATNAANRSATAQARNQLRFDQTALDRAEDQLEADRDSCEASPRATRGAASAAAAPPAGGAATGGVATGGAATGGAATGGVATGGAATGGVATGGATTGGVATGGATTGGATTGGATTGGATTGGATTGGATTGGTTSGGATTGGTTTGGTTSGGTTSGGTTSGGTTSGGTTSGGTTTGGSTSGGSTSGGSTSGSSTSGSTTSGSTTSSGHDLSRSRAAVVPTRTPDTGSARSSRQDAGEDRDSDGGSGGRTTAEAAAAPEPVVSTRVALLAASSPLDDVDDDVDLGDERTGAACSRLLSDRSAVTQAQGAVVTARSNLDAAQERERTEAASGQVSLENARTSVVSAQNQLLTANNDSPRDIRAQEAQVADARAGVALAQKTVDQTVITAPVAGTITEINGTTGEVVGVPSATTSLAPGGTAPLPAASGGTSGSTGGGAAGAGGSFLVLDAADPFQVVVPFEEADAARVAPGQQVDVAVDALPDDRLTGQVTSVAPAGVDLSGIVSYYATVVVTGGADRLRSGQTAEANVRVESVDNALRVPASAVRRVDGRPTVTVTGPDGTPQSVPFLAGLVGDDYVEVRSGLNDGAAVELPQATVSAAADPGGPPPGN